MTIINNMNIKQPQDMNAYPFLSGLHQLGMDIAMQGERLAIYPQDKVTSKIIEVARVNREAIIAEINQLAMAAAEDNVEMVRACQLQQSRWQIKAGEPDHNYELLDLVLRAMFFECEKIYLHTKIIYWDGEPEPKPAQRPYCYIRSICVGIPGSDAKQWKYWPILAHQDGEDYMWIEAVESQGRAEFQY